jgi:hypothetical protein
MITPEADPVEKLGHSQSDPITVRRGSHRPPTTTPTPTPIRERQTPAPDVRLSNWRPEPRHNEPGASVLIDVLAQDLSGLGIADVVIEGMARVGDL